MHILGVFVCVLSRNERSSSLPAPFSRCLPTLRASTSHVPHDTDVVSHTAKPVAMHAGPARLWCSLLSRFGVARHFNPFSLVGSSSGVPRNFVRWLGGGGSTNSVEGRENGDLGAVAP